MKSLTIDNLHARFAKHIALVESYTEELGAEFIIKSCRLKPYDYLFTNKSQRLILHRKWFDEYGSSLILKGKKLEIIHNDTAVIKSKIICTDMYDGIGLQATFRMSKILYICGGKTSEYQDTFVLGLLGLDNFIRTYYYTDDEWVKISPLSLGIDALKEIYFNQNFRSHDLLKSKIKTGLPINKNKSWISGIPLEQEMFDTLKFEYDDTFTFLKPKER